MAKMNSCIHLAFREWHDFIWMLSINNNLYFFPCLPLYKLGHDEMRRIFLHCQFTQPAVPSEWAGYIYFGPFSGQDVIEEEEVVETQQQ